VRKKKRSICDACLRCLSSPGAPHASRTFLLPIHVEAGLHGLAPTFSLQHNPKRPESSKWLVKFSRGCFSGCCCQLSKFLFKFCRRRVAETPTTPCPSPLQWRILPLEIQLAILDCLVEELAPQLPLAPYCTVCRQWQDVLEPKIFSRLTITGKNLSSLGNITPRHREMVGYIWLDINIDRTTRLPFRWFRYDDEYHLDEYQEEAPYVKEPDTVFRRIKTLLEILSSWPQTGRPLILDISARHLYDRKLDMYVPPPYIDSRSPCFFRSLLRPGRYPHARRKGAVRNEGVGCLSALAVPPPPLDNTLVIIDDSLGIEHVLLEADRMELGLTGGPTVHA